MSNMLNRLALQALSPAELAAGFPKASLMAATPQDKLYHAEGNVWRHTLMVMDEVKRFAFPDNAGALRLAALLHDVAKPQTTVEEFCETEQRMRVRQPNHAAKGRDESWQLLTDAGIDPRLKREVCDIVAWHQRPTHLPDQRHIENRIMRYASLGRDWRTLLDFCRADNLGRISPNVAETMGLLDLVEDEVKRVSDAVGHDLLDRAPRLSGARIRYLHADYGNSIHHEPHDNPGRAVLRLMVGPPGSGKTTLREGFDAEVVSLDEERAAIKRFKHGSPDEGRVLQSCLKKLKEALAARRDVVWDATALTRQTRAKIVTLGEAYGAKVEIWSIEDSADVCRDRNASRGEHAIPRADFEGMLRKREAVGREEAEEVHVVIDGKVVDLEPAEEAPAPGL